MYKKNKILAVIPARSGSKGLKDKNIKNLCGKPLIAYTIESAKSCGLIDEICVSTDSLKYAEIAKNYGASIPFLRSSYLSNDTADSWDVVIDALQWYEVNGKNYDWIILLQPTSPLRDEIDILNALKVMDEKEANLIISVCEAEHSPLWTGRISKENTMEDFYRKEDGPRQKLPKYYRLNGAIYVISRNFLMNELKKIDNIYNRKCFATIMCNLHSIDIDNEMDFLMAEFFIKRKNY